MPIICHSCEKPFADYKTLALHILATPKGHRKGRLWAARYIQINGLSLEKRLNHRKYTSLELTEEDKENKRNTARELSGNTQLALTVCPQCKSKNQQLLPAEFTQSPFSWRIKDNLVVLCGACRK